MEFDVDFAPDDVLNQVNNMAIELTKKMDEQKDINDDVKEIKNRYRESSINPNLVTKALRRLIQKEKNPEEDEKIEKLVELLKSSTDLREAVKKLVKR